MRRIAVLAVIAVVLAVLLAPALRSFVAQRRQIDGLTGQVAAQRTAVADLRRARGTWDDPAFVKAQARDRLKFVMPGERAYTVIDPTPSGRSPAASKRVAAPPAPDDRAWFANLWRSTQIAGTTPPAAKR